MARKQTQPHMTDEDRRFIYRTLKKKFDFDEEYPLASLGWCFVREGIDREDYGFLKLKPMLEEMSDFVSMSTKEIGGVSQSMFSLHEFEPYESDASDISDDDADEGRKTASKDAASFEDERKEGFQENADIQKDSDSQKKEDDKKKQGIKSKQEEKENTKDKKALNSKKDTKADNEVKRISKDAGIEGSEKDGSVSSRDSSSSADAGSERNDGTDRSKGDAARKRVSEKKDDAAEKPASAEKGEAGRASAAKTAQEGGEPAAKTDDAAKEPRRGDSDAASANGKPAKASVRRSAKTGSSTAAKAAVPEREAAEKPNEGEPGDRARKKADADVSSRRKPKQPSSAKEQPPARPERRMRRRVIPGKALERFGYLGTWQEFLETLAGLALDEPWDFNDAGLDVRTRRFDILHNYIRYTFYRLTLEDKVGFSADEDFAAWNTGLVDRHYEDIYACFEPSDPANPDEARYSWTFSGFCTAGTGRLGKRLVRELNPLPQPASYLERKEDLLFDLDREVVCDVHHIVVDNVHRLPVNFLRDELASSQECLGILAGVEELSDGARGERFEKLRGVIENDTRLFNRLSTSINAAIDVAKRQVRWNYKTAVPAYYPRTNSMNLLLPLILTDSSTPDVALVVELQKSGNYQGQTIVTMAQAYRDARLLCRPYIDWLSPASIIDAAEEEDEEE